MATARPLFWLVLLGSLVYTRAQDGASTSLNNQPPLVVFGDSLSDIGARLAATNNKDPDPRWYYNGRYSDSTNWVDTLLKDVGLLQVLDYAFGGAPACPDALSGDQAFVPSLDEQIDQYFSNVTPVRLSLAAGMMAGGPVITSNSAKLMSDRVMIVEIGANDYIIAISDNIASIADLDDVFENLPPKVIGCISAGVERLIASGEKRILVFGLPPIASTPLVNAVDFIPNLKETVNATVIKHNALLEQAVADLAARYPDVSVAVFNSTDVTMGILANPAQYGISNTDDPCLNYQFDDAALAVIKSIGEGLKDIAEGVGCKIGGALDNIPFLGSWINDKICPDPTQTIDTAMLQLPYLMSQFSNNQITGKCDNAKAYAFLDAVHPTSTVYTAVAKAVTVRLQELGWWDSPSAA